MTEARTLNILVLFAGAGLATRGLLNAGHTCTDVEIDPAKVHLSKILNPEAVHITSDVLDLDMDFIRSFDAVWASPPCQKRSRSNVFRKEDNYPIHDDLLRWSLGLDVPILWVENVIEQGDDNSWGGYYNAPQFLDVPIQTRNRLIGGHFALPFLYRRYKPTYSFDGWQLPGAVTASMHKRLKDSHFRSNTCEDFYGYVPTLDQVAFLQGIDALPIEWYDPMPAWELSYEKWRDNLYQAIGNGVPVYMAQSFGEAYSRPRIQPLMKQLDLFSEDVA